MGIKQSNYMTNILPHVAQMNRGAWLLTEEIVECFRDKTSLTVVGGAVYDDSSKRHDWFKRTHGVPVPVYFWKLIHGNPAFFGPDTHGVAAFWIPNSASATRSSLADHIVSVAELEQELGRFGQ